MDCRAHIVASGMVQGVGFRYFVYDIATRLGLSGFVRNLYTGEVEIEVEGDRSLVEQLIKEVKVGPRAARVTDVRVDWKLPEHRFYHFEIQ